jgi:hypothetical protein
MSSPKAALAKPRRAKPAIRAVVKPAPTVAKPAPETSTATGLAEGATHLAAALERELAEGHSDMLTPAALQALMGALCRTYAAQVEAGSDALPLAERGSVANTDVMILASALLRSANLAVFELGMWQSWTGR